LLLRMMTLTGILKILIVTLYNVLTGMSKKTV
jgi:hypothetical protein